MKVQIMTNTKYGNGKLLAEALQKEFSSDVDVNIADVKDISPQKIADDVPNAIILGAAIRAFRVDPKSKKWLMKLNKHLEKSGKKIQYGTGFITHAMPTEKTKGYVKKYLNKIETTSMIESTYSQLLTARVKEIKGPLFPEEIEKARGYIKDFINWIQK
jgi:menaquinone-dependent protoporphyrinogen IX oxidase